jgi:acetylornithine deacetylase
MANWAAGALQLALNRKRSDDDPGTCINIGIIDGGTKSNVIAGTAFVHWSARLRPGESNEEFLAEIQSCDVDGSSTEWEVPFSGHPLPASGQSDDSARAFCQQHGLELGDSVDFWTEASLFSQAGLPAMVLGPGHISQAHIVDEWVDLQQLSTAHDMYSRVVKHNG